MHASRSKFLNRLPGVTLHSKPADYTKVNQITHERDGGSVVRAQAAHDRDSGSLVRALAVHERDGGSVVRALTAHVSPGLIPSDSILSLLLHLTPPNTCLLQDVHTA